MSYMDQFDEDNPHPGWSNLRIIKDSEMAREYQAASVEARKLNAERKQKAKD